MNREGLETELIRHCAPTLAGLKSAGLFRYFYEEKACARREVEWLNELLNDKGVYIEVLLWQEQAALIYTYRLSHLQKELQTDGVRRLLREYGYRDCGAGECIMHLKERLDEYICFPHEIGVFLGYPLEDVQGFIKNRGQNCECCGLWKVYCNASEKEKMFCKLRKCTQVYAKRFSEGGSLRQMTVCA